METAQINGNHPASLDAFVTSDTRTMTSTARRFPGLHPCHRTEACLVFHARPTEVEPLRGPRSVVSWHYPAFPSDRQAWHLVFDSPTSLDSDVRFGPGTVPGHHAQEGSAGRTQALRQASSSARTGTSPCDLRCRGLAAFRVLIHQCVRTIERVESRDRRCSLGVLFLQGRSSNVRLV